MYNDYSGDTDINPKIRPLPKVCEKTCFKGGDVCYHLLQNRFNGLIKSEKYHPLCHVWVKISFSKGGNLKTPFCQSNDTKQIMLPSTTQPQVSYNQNILICETGYSHLKTDQI